MIYKEVIYIMKKTRNAVLVMMIALLLSACASPDLAIREAPVGGSNETETVSYQPIEYTEAFPGEYESLCIGESRECVPNDYPHTMGLQYTLCRMDAGDESDNLLVMYRVCHPELDIADYDVRITTPDTDVIEIGEMDKGILFSCYPGAVNIKALKPGTAHIYIDFVHNSTGQKATLQQIIIVRE